MPAPTSCGESLCAEAIRLARLLADLMPDEPEAVGLFALMLLHDARRVHPGGRRRCADHAGAPGPRGGGTAGDIDEGVAALETALRRGRAGPYQIQAAIAACHATAADAAATDWVADRRALYGRLARLVPSPVVRLNQAVAVAMADGPAAGLALVDALAAGGELAGYHLLPATRADLLRRLGRAAEAAEAYRAALDLAATDAERRYLAGRLTETRRPSGIGECRRGYGLGSWVLGRRRMACSSGSSASATSHPTRRTVACPRSASASRRWSPSR